jgi:hypothetical protein
MSASPVDYGAVTSDGVPEVVYALEKNAPGERATNPIRRNPGVPLDGEHDGLSVISEYPVIGSEVVSEKVTHLLQAHDGGPVHHGRGAL